MSEIFLLIILFYQLYIILVLTTGIGLQYPAKSIGKNTPICGFFIFFCKKYFIGMEFVKQTVLNNSWV